MDFIRTQRVDYCDGILLWVKSKTNPTVVRSVVIDRLSFFTTPSARKLIEYIESRVAKLTFWRQSTIDCLMAAARDMQEPVVLDDSFEVRYISWPRG